MAQVFLNIHGDGTATVDNEYPTIDDPEFTIYSIPGQDSSLERIQAWTYNDLPIATPQDLVCTMTWRPIFGNVYVDIYFTGSTPPEPPEPFNFDVLYVILAKAANRWRL